MKNIILIGLTLIFCVGCSIFPAPKNVKTNYFDIGFPEQSTIAGKDITVKPFMSIGPHRTSMVFRTADNKLELDTVNHWINPPQTLLRNYFIIGLENERIRPREAQQLNLKAEILRFEGDLRRKVAIITLNVTISKPDGTILLKEVYNEQVAVEKEVASEYAQAMGKAVAVIVDKVKDRIRQFK